MKVYRLRRGSTSVTHALRYQIESGGRVMLCGVPRMTARWRVGPLPSDFEELEDQGPSCHVCRRHMLRAARRPEA